MRGFGGERRQERGHKLGTGLTAFLAPRASALSRSQRAGLFVLRSSFNFFPLLGEGRKEGSNEGDFGGSAVQLLFLFSVASNLGLSPA